MADTGAIDQVLQAAVSSGTVPGVVAVAADDSGVIYQGAFGRRSLASDAPMTLDTVFRIASMTKAITGTAAMQMLERGRLSLDQPAGEVMPELASPMVLEGFNDAGKPSLRPARGAVTLRNLLTHTSGFVYDTWNANMARFARETGMPAARTGKLAALHAPLGFEPGERWEYGIGIDWAGRMVEAVNGGANLEAYMQREIFGPLGMRDSSFDPRPEWASRTVTVHARQADGSLVPMETAPPPVGREFYPGGGGLFSTAPDYITFLRALLAGGGGVLKPETVGLMAQNHMGTLNVGPLKTHNPAFSNDAEFFPGMDKKWGLTFMINTRDTPNGRSAGSLAWAGINNTYFWLDLNKRVAGVLMAQILPFADAGVLGLLDRFEAAVYGGR
ncbi:MAG TPA: serine hydrolase domain-containing protein [Acetobacteraceae bacterium]|jgi:CubicO group peptidase (beta-lactamase class C family)